MNLGHRRRAVSVLRARSGNIVRSALHFLGVTRPPLLLTLSVVTAIATAGCSWPALRAVGAGRTGPIRRAQSPMARSGMQYRTPDRTAAIELPWGHFRVDGCGWMGRPLAGALVSPLAPHATHGGGTGAGSMRRSRIGKPAAKMPVTSTIENTGYILALQGAYYSASVSEPWLGR